MSKEPKWFQFWRKNNDRQTKAIEKLAEAVLALQKAREKGTKNMLDLLDDPVRMGNYFRSVLAAAVPETSRVGPQPIVAALLPSKEQIKEASEEAVGAVTGAILAKMEEMEKHIETAIRELPAPVVEKIAEKIKAGEDFTLRRRHGCIHIDFGYGDEEFYLKL